MKRIEKLIKNNYKLVVGVLIGLVLSIGSVYAVEKVSMIDSEEVTYDNNTSHGDYDNVQETIDELYKKVGFTGEKWIDPTLNGADPVLGDKLIPVVISSKGDTYYANEYTEWYDYSQKRWANAVILVENTDKTYNPGDKIDEKDIESYFVWIPRYKYKIWNTGNYTSAISGDNLANIKDDGDTAGKYALRNILGNARVIDVVFGDKTHVIEGNDTKKSGKSGDMSVNVGEYLIHPAFTLGETELNGIWVGKFETGYNQDGDNGSPITPDNWTTQGAEQDSESPKRIIIKPNVYSWRYNTVKNFFMSAYEYKSELKSHMMKNTEWGAVAYLSHSSYGIGGEINNNNNSDYKTGYSAVSGTNQNGVPGDNGTGNDKALPWNTSTGYLASTTGNITGVYDMSGGSREYMAAYISENVGSSGFDNDTDLKSKYKDYIDVYNSSTNTAYNNRILGDATGEMGSFILFKDADGTDRNHNSWYYDDSNFVNGNLPWFHRGGDRNDGILAGQFLFDRSNGSAHNEGSFRLVLSIS